ncbi:RNA-directed DNA polymerase from mobile element jockey-like protein [Elysia marginata]|uniref:RNA-directed DNA polymerase from mobile element jockey-like protein n=1 Tax=Elysia marginata TaxID=1093978 RepID=A0AAV4HCA9_9GAST|nr:RNA-directed DNA polymerase from mobile element jockey-like protein [Elysia marginata]
MEVNSQLITSSQKKADQFAKMYKEVSEVRHQKLSLADSVELSENINRDRQYLRIVGRVANSECSCSPDGYCAPFNKKELDASLAQLKNTSPGVDQIHKKLLTHLPPSGKMALLTLFNRVYKSGQYPAAWRKGTIIPILKTGKDPAFMSSYRPIQLTSCLSKLFEMLVKVRMNYWLESEKLLNPKQAGF